MIHSKIMAKFMSQQLQLKVYILTAMGYGAARLHTAQLGAHGATFKNVNK